MVNLLESHFYAGYMPQQRNDEPKKDGFPQWLFTLPRLSQALRVSVNELLFGKTERGPYEDLRLQFETISRFNEYEKKVVRSVLEGLLTHEARKWSAGTSSAKENTP